MAEKGGRSPSRKGRAELPKQGMCLKLPIPGHPLGQGRCECQVSFNAYSATSDTSCLAANASAMTSSVATSPKQCLIKRDTKGISVINLPGMEAAMPKSAAKRFKPESGNPLNPLRAETFNKLATWPVHLNLSLVAFIADWSFTTSTTTSATLQSSMASTHWNSKGSDAKGASVTSLEARSAGLRCVTNPYFDSSS